MRENFPQNPFEKDVSNLLVRPNLSKIHEANNLVPLNFLAYRPGIILILYPLKDNNICFSELWPLYYLNYFKKHFCHSKVAYVCQVNGIILTYGLTRKWFGVLWPEGIDSYHASQIFFLSSILPYMPVIYTKFQMNPCFMSGITHPRRWVPPCWNTCIFYKQ